MATSVLDAPLPARWSRRQRWKNTAIYAVVRALFAVLAWLPFGLVAAFIGLLALLAPHVARSDRRRALQHLAIAFPELGEAARLEIVRGMFRHLGRSAAEAMRLSRFLEGPRAVRLSPEQKALLDAAVAEDKGVVAVTGHIGNWELLAQVVARAGYPITSIAKPLYDPRLTRWVHEQRTAHGMKLVWRGDDSAGKDMLRVFRDKGVLALLIDQDTKVQGAFVPFFGKPAHTPTAAAALALRFGAPLLVAWDHRVDGRHVLHFERVPYADSGDRDADVVALTAELNLRLERAIRMQPEQWVWMHRRWKTQEVKAEGG